MILAPSGVARFAFALLLLSSFLPAGAADEKKPEAPADNPAAATREHRDKLIAKARARMRQDRQKYSADQLTECEELYQVANKNWRTPQAKESLAKMLEKYPDVNRTGCALVYMGQMSKGEDKEKYLKQSIKDFDGCYYGNGVQVGPWARMLLAWHYEKTKPDEAKALLEEVKKNYPDSIDHRGNLLVKIIEQSEAAAATQPAK